MAVTLSLVGAGTIAALPLIVAVTLPLVIAGTIVAALSLVIARTVPAALPRMIVVTLPRVIAGTVAAALPFYCAFDGFFGRLRARDFIRIACANVASRFPDCRRVQV